MNLEEFKNILKTGNYDDVKPFLRMEVRNKANLSPNAYYNPIIGDIVTVLTFQTMLDDNSYVSAIVTNTLMNSLGDSTIELLSDAKENTPCNFKIDRLSNIVFYIRKEGKPFSGQHSLDFIDILSASDELIDSVIVVSIDSITRVSILQFPKLLRHIYSKIGDYYIVPSSVYEQMIIPADKMYDSDQINTLIRNVNSTAVDSSDVLSDKLLKYNALGLSEC